jgi:hypothetical protein
LIAQDIGIVDGRLTIGRGRTITLPDVSTFTTAGITILPTNYNNIIMEYTLTHGSNQRTGVFRVTKFGGVYSWDEDYTESSAANFYLQVNSSTGDIEYFSGTTGGSTTLIYNLRYLTP